MAELSPSTDPRPNIWTRLRELRREISQEGFWNRREPEVDEALREFTGILERLGGIEAMDDPRGQP